MNKNIELTNSLLWDLVTEYAELSPRIYFKSSLTALARAMQDLVLADDGKYLVIANFQQERYFRQIEQRFRRMAVESEQVYVMGVPDTESGFAVDNSGYETIPLDATNTLAGERYLIIIGEKYSACLVVQEKFDVEKMVDLPSLEQGEKYEGIWTFDRALAYSAADWLLGRIVNLRPELKTKTDRARRMFITKRNQRSRAFLNSQTVDLSIFTRSLITYLQSGQYKLLKAYRKVAIAERKEALSNKIAAAQRSSFNPEEILATTVEELGKVFPQCRCILYRLEQDAKEVKIHYESVPVSMTSLVGALWSISDNPLFISAQAQRSTLVIDDVTNNSYLNENNVLRDKITKAGIRSWLMVSVRYQRKLLGMLELHYGDNSSFQWRAEDLSLLESVATSAGTALTQASAYNRLAELNTQLEAVERIQRNLIAIVGHELRTPVSTIRICLESLASEPDIPLEIKDSMLDTALEDTDRLEKLIQNFITLSQLEGGKAYRNIESLTVDYPLNLALNRIRATSRTKQLPKIGVKLPDQLPVVLADIDGLVDVFVKLLDNACKFTPLNGEVTISARVFAPENFDDTISTNIEMLEVIVADTGRGIEPELLETIFDRFSQSESYLRRSVNGIGLGLVICRQIIESMDGQIWADSEGEDQGCQFHFTLKIDSNLQNLD
ncbi:MAG: DICT sensory domain-containing protein [Cyanobacteria bacterium J06621_8]